jgi:LPXTG-site transpeptidase (sortase) family protein
LKLFVIGVGLLVVVFGVLWQLGLWPGSQISLPQPVALAPTLLPTTIPQPPVLPTATSTPRVQLTAVPTPMPTPIPQPTPAPIHIVVADAADRASQTPEPATGYAVRLAVPSINLDTEVVQGGIVRDQRGNSIWQTLPFVAVHYGDLTSLIGAQGNAVISGHVVTIDEGNVFRNLYEVAIGDQVQVWDQRDREYDYHVVGIKLVPPSDISVMAPTPDQTLTLITCGGTFDRLRREFSARLIVTAKPVALE